MVWQQLFPGGILLPPRLAAKRRHLLFVFIWIRGTLSRSDMTIVHLVESSHP
jgi:hypothetical protein